MIVIKAEFFSMMTESSFRPNKGTGSLSESMTPYFGNSCLRIKVLSPFENALLTTISYMVTSLRYWVVMSAKIFSDRNLKLVELLFKILSNFGSKCCKIGSWASINAFLIELKHSTIWSKAYKKSSEPSNLAFSHPSSNLLVVSIKSRDMIHPLNI